MLSTLRSFITQDSAPDLKSFGHTPAPISHDTLQPCVPGRDCDDCPNQEHRTSDGPLCLVKPGTKVRVVSVAEGRRFRKRLADLGLAPGMEVNVLRASHARGPMILGLCGDARLAIGWGMANKIIVQELG